MKKLVEFFASEHLLGNIISLVIIVLGSASLYFLKREVFPPVDFDTTIITVPTPGASPEQVEKLVVSPIEEQLREVDGIKKTFSTSTEGTGVIILQLDPDARDADDTNKDIEQAVDRVHNLPDTAEDPIITIADTTKRPVIQVTVSGSVSDLELRKYAKDLSDKFRNVKGVGAVNKEGFLNREYLVEASPSKLAQKNVSLSALISAIKNQNVLSPGGSILDANGGEILIKTDGQYQSPNDILTTVIRSNDEGYGPVIGDVAIARETLEEPVYLYRANNKRAIKLTILKKKNADVIRTVEEVKKTVEELRKELPKGIELDLVNDFSVYVKNRINILSSNLFFGLILVILVLSFLLPFRVALVVAFGIPIALFCTLITAGKIDISINLISLIGLIIVLGMVVDDAIVVCENIWRYFEKGLKPLQAVSLGVVEVIPPVTASVLTTMIAFAPLASMSGIMGKFIYEIPIMVILALIFSLLEIFIIMPSHFISWVRIPKKLQSNGNGGFEQKAKWFTKVQGKYSKYIHWTIHHRYKMLAISFLGLIASVIIVAKFGKFILFPPEGVEAFFVKVEGPKYLPLDKTEEAVAKIEKQIHELLKKSNPNAEIVDTSAELKDTIAMIGISRQDSNDPLTKRGSNYGQIQIQLTPESDRNRKANQIIEYLKENVKLPKDILASYVVQKGGPPQGRPVSIDLLGENLEKLNTIAKEVIEELKKYEAVDDIQSSYLIGKDELSITPKQRELTAVGLSTTDLALGVRAAFDGVVASTVRDLDDEIRIRVKLQNGFSNAKKEVENLKIGNQIGNLIPLNQVASFETKGSISAIFHKEYKRLLNVSSSLDTKLMTSNEIIKKITPFLNTIKKKYPEVSFELGGENEDTKESMQSLMRAFVAAFLGIFALLIITFKRISQPILILFAIPMGVFGAIFALMIHGRPMSFMSMLGIVALSGVIVNNAIVLIDFVNKQKNSGLNRFDAIESAAVTRLRPVFLTTLTTVSGLMPTAYGWGGSDPFIKPLALALGWGLAFGATLVALFFPSLIAILDDLFEWMGKLWTKHRKKSLENI